MSKHPTEIHKYEGNLTQLAQEIASLRYDRLAEFLDALRVKLAIDSEDDQSVDRFKLAAQLNEAAISIESALTAIENAWEISKPFVLQKEISNEISIRTNS